MKHLPRFTDSEIEEEMILLQQASSKPWARLKAKCLRIFIRLMRFAVGAVLFACFVYCAHSAMEKFEIPFAAQSIAGVAGGIFWACMALLLVMWSWSAAFGPGPTPDEAKEMLRNKALESLTVKRPAGMSIQTSVSRYG